MTFIRNSKIHLDDDFNTADAISAIFELVKLANSNSSSDNSKEYIDTLMKKITTLTDILGLKTDKKEEMLDEDIEALIAERQQARKDKNLQELMKFEMSYYQRELFLRIQERA